MQGLLLRCVAALTVCLLACADDGLTADEIHIGSSAALSGPAAELGIQFHRGAAVYFAEVNRKGGIFGRRIDPTLLDDSYEPTRAAINTDRLVNHDKVFALFGYVGTPTSNAALPFIASAKVPLVAAYTGADSLREPFNPYVFNVRASYREEAQKAVSSLRATSVKRINVAYQYDAFGTAGLDAIRAAARAQGVEIGQIASLQRNNVQVESAVHALTEVAPADAIYLVSTYATCAAFMRAARQRGYKGQFYALSFTGLEPLRRELNGKLKGITLTQVVPDASDSAIPVVAAYQKAMRAGGHEQFSSISLEGYIAARVLVEGLRRAGEHPSRQSLAQGLESLHDLDLGGYKVQFGPRQHNGAHWVGLHRE